MDKKHPLIIIGDSAFAEIAYEYFTCDSPYEVAAFSVEQAYLKRSALMGLPVVPFEELERHYPPGTHRFFAAIVYSQLNRLRTRLYRQAKAKGYVPASYISSRAFVWRNCRIGEHCFIFENNIIQPFVEIGDNVILWSGNHLGHHSRIQDHCFISSQVVISGFVNVGQYCFLGVNATVANNIAIGPDCLIGAGALVTNEASENTVIKGARSDSRSNCARAFCNIG